MKWFTPLCKSHSKVITRVGGIYSKFSRCFGSCANVPLVKSSSKIREEWERNKSESDKDNAVTLETPYGIKSNAHGVHTVFGKSQPMKSKVGLKFISQLQGISKSTSTAELYKIFASISERIDDFAPYELIDIGYFMTRINKVGCSEVVEPILHRFFSMPERYSCLNGIYIHRLLRTMFIFQDVTYRVWIYDIARIVGIKHQHLLMRDLQLIIDDLSLFYDAAAQGALLQFESSIVERSDQLEIYRLPLVVHALGRCGYNSVQVARAIHESYLKKRNNPDYYSPQLIGLLLKGYASFHFHPGRKFLYDIWENIKNHLVVAEFKYISWIGESFLKLRYVDHVPNILQELMMKHHLLSHLEFTDFITNCCSIQSHILELEFQNFINPDSLWHSRKHWYENDDPITHEGNLNPAANEKLNPIDKELNANCGNKEGIDNYELDGTKEKNSTEGLYLLYKQLFNLVLQEMPNKIYESTPPYRATQFELLTRLLDLYPTPRDFREALPLKKYDIAFPLLDCILDYQNSSGKTTLNDVFVTNSHFMASKYFGCNSNGAEFDNGEVKPIHDVILVQESIAKSQNVKLEPLHDIFKQYLHSVFFRTPALAPRGLRIMIQGLVRVHFEQREDCVLDPDLLPRMKIEEKRPLSRAIIREVYRKLACYNTDDLIVSLYGMVILKVFHLDLAETLILQLTEMWLHHKKENQICGGQLELIKGFYSLLESEHPNLYEKVKVKILDF
ncbi:uncharacterized protein BdWA1_003555 [Babesia duncani]|uniref:Uncharacterized protein n=1 Tax=Babesia duncani TaxID=323732 RepID=A0AAD9UMF9_9APIC|nr:hypothetical protein BdWA1_003555 [Babesia duncani]